MEPSRIIDETNVRRLLIVGENGNLTELSPSTISSPLSASSGTTSRIRDTLRGEARFLQPVSELAGAAEFRLLCLREDGRITLGTVASVNVRAGGSMSRLSNWHSGRVTPVAFPPTRSTRSRIVSSRGTSELPSPEREDLRRGDYSPNTGVPNPVLSLGSTFETSSTIGS